MGRKISAIRKTVASFIFHFSFLFFEPFESVDEVADAKLFCDVKLYFVVVLAYSEDFARSYGKVFVLVAYFILWVIYHIPCSC